MVDFCCNTTQRHQATEGNRPITCVHRHFEDKITAAVMTCYKLLCSVSAPDDSISSWMLGHTQTGPPGSRFIFSPLRVATCPHQHSFCVCVFFFFLNRSIYSLNVASASTLIGRTWPLHVVRKPWKRPKTWKHGYHEFDYTNVYESCGDLVYHDSTFDGTHRSAKPTCNRVYRDVLCTYNTSLATSYCYYESCKSCSALFWECGYGGTSGSRLHKAGLPLHPLWSKLGSSECQWAPAGWECGGWGGGWIEVRGGVEFRRGGQASIVYR